MVYRRGRGDMREVRIRVLYRGVIRVVLRLECLLINYVWVVWRIGGVVVGGVGVHGSDGVQAQRV